MLPVQEQTSGEQGNNIIEVLERGVEKWPACQRPSPLSFLLFLNGQAKQDPLLGNGTCYTNLKLPRWPCLPSHRFSTA